MKAQKDSTESDYKIEEIEVELKDTIFLKIIQNLTKFLNNGNKQRRTNNDYFLINYFNFSIILVLQKNIWCLQA